MNSCLGEAAGPAAARGFVASALATDGLLGERPDEHSALLARWTAAYGADVVPGSNVRRPALLSECSGPIAGTTIARVTLKAPR